MMEGVTKEQYQQSSFLEVNLSPKDYEEQRRRRVREALSPYVSMSKLRRLAASQGNLYEALQSDAPPPEVVHLIDLLSDVLYPPKHEQITSPAEMAALLMVEMGHLQQEQLRVVCLSTQYHVQRIHLVYQGNVNSAQVRVAEIFREPIRLNSTAIILAHNHPSSSVDPSPEDLLVTAQVVAAGKLLSIELLDHIIVGQGKWTSIREKMSSESAS
jgi:hypothetical protein